ncbi:MAG: SPOR domain-containing protein [bacterium]|nr:SPOR domain-containing protein [Gammaproteobacteria bacterium]HIL94584.1 SPOR domain-containing protein [Pseudomonadales bacterium]
MPQDYAKRHTTISDSSISMPRWAVFIIGFLFGMFTMFLIYLWKFVPLDAATHTKSPIADIISDKKLSRLNRTIKEEIEEIQWDFYEIFPKSEVPIVEEYAPRGEKIVTQENYSYALQTGSFQNPDDANRLRAELILIGMHVYIQEINNDNIKWHRVLVGPFDSKLELDRARDRLAQANIESIRLRMNQ